MIVNMAKTIFGQQIGTPCTGCPVRSVRKFFEIFWQSFWSKLDFKVGNRFSSARGSKLTLNRRKRSSEVPPTNIFKNIDQNLHFPFRAQIDQFYGPIMEIILWNRKYCETYYEQK